jgi:uncharacterized protein (TIGR02453 family)
MNPSVFEFLSNLQQNNNREWFADNKTAYEKAKDEAYTFFESVANELMKIDEFSKFKMYRIYRDVRFSTDKSPYKNHFGGIFMRLQPHNRGSFYVHLEPGNTFIGGGFWNPNKEDLQRIRQGIEIENDLEIILNEPKLKKEFGGLFGESLKTAPKGFDKEHSRIDLIRYKQFLLKKDFDNKTVFSPTFKEQVVDGYTTMQPFFLYLTDVLTTDANGESIL